MAKDKAPAFQFYPDSWLSSTAVSLMSPAEEGAYIRLLSHAWMQEDCGLPDDDSVLSKLSRLEKAWFRGSGKRLREKFVSRNGRLYNDRLLEERKKQLARREGLSSAGRAGMEKRYGKRKRDNQAIAELDENPNQAITDPRLSLSSSSSSSSPSSGATTETVVAHDRSEAADGQAAAEADERASERTNTPPEAKQDLEQVVHETAAVMCKNHVTFSVRDTVKDALREILVQADNPAEMSGNLVAAHLAHLPSMQQKLAAGDFVPHLHKWLSEREWLFSPRPTDAARPKESPPKTQRARSRMEQIEATMADEIAWRKQTRGQRAS